jgi:hypothetical protein
MLSGYTTVHRLFDDRPRPSAPNRPLAKYEPPIKTSPEKPGNINSPVISGYVKDKTTMLLLDTASVFIVISSTNEVLVLKTNPDGYFETPVTKGVLYIAKAMVPNYFDDCLNFRIPPENPSFTLPPPGPLARQIRAEPGICDKKYLLRPR